MKKELKRQIKQDELVSGFQEASRWTTAHASEVKITAVVVAVVALGAFAIMTYQGHQRGQAERAFTAALDTFHLPVSAELPEGFEPPPGPVFATAAEKYKKAASEFDEVARKFGSLDVGRRARYYGALSHMELGEYDVAEKALGEIGAKRDGDALESSLARLALADLHRRRGQLDKAVEDYRRLIDDSSFVLPRDHALRELAATLEAAKRPAEAATAYRRLFEDFPSSVYAAEARRRADYLKGGAAPAQG
jgi:predicted negative regulator of RcsB-dependent stress response